MRFLRVFQTIVAPICVAILIPSCVSTSKGNNRGNTGSEDRVTYTEELTDTLSRIAAKAPGKIGIALIVNGRDTITVNTNNV